MFDLTAGFVQVQRFQLIEHQAKGGKVSDDVVRAQHQDMGLRTPGEAAQAQAGALAEFEGVSNQLSIRALMAVSSRPCPSMNATGTSSSAWQTAVGPLRPPS